MKNKFAFTLAEVLVTLVVIGVVAALTIPTAVSKYQEQQTIQSLKTAYTIFSQAVKLAEAKNGPVETWDIDDRNSQEGALKLYNYIAPSLSKVKDCGKNSGCFDHDYVTLQGTEPLVQPKWWTSYARGILNNGMPFLVWSNGSDCVSSTDNWGDYCGIIRVDINGDKKPNRYGYDFFSFLITKNGLKPAGYVNGQLLKYCQYSSNYEENGLNCTAWVLYKNNFDYKNRDVSW